MPNEIEPFKGVESNNSKSKTRRINPKYSEGIYASDKWAEVHKIPRFQRTGENALMILTPLVTAFFVYKGCSVYQESPITSIFYFMTASFIVFGGAMTIPMIIESRRAERDAENFREAMIKEMLERDETDFNK